MFESEYQPQLRSIEQAAVELGVCVRTLQYAVKNGEIAVTRLGSKRGRIFFTAEAIREYLTRKTIPAFADDVATQARHLLRM